MEHELLWSLSSRGTWLWPLPGFPCRSEPHTLLGCLRPGLGQRADSRALGGSGFKDTGALCSQLGCIGTEAVRALSVTSGTHTFPHPAEYTPGPVLPVGEVGGCMCPVGGTRNGMGRNIAVRQANGLCWHKRVLRRETGSWKRVQSAQIQPGSPDRKRTCFRLQAISQWESFLSLSAPVQSRTGGLQKSVLTRKSQPWLNFSFSS